MIHDIDLVLSMVGSPLRKVDALGLLGPRRPRGRGQRPARVRVRLRGDAFGVAGQLRSGSADARLVGRGVSSPSISPPAPPRWSVPAKRSATAVFRRCLDAGAARALPRIILPKSICRRSVRPSTPSMPWPWSIGRFRRVDPHRPRAARHRRGGPRRPGGGRADSRLHRRPLAAKPWLTVGQTFLSALGGQERRCRRGHTNLSSPDRYGQTTYPMTC